MRAGFGINGWGGAGVECGGGVPTDGDGGVPGVRAGADVVWRAGGGAVGGGVVAVVVRERADLGYLDYWGVIWDIGA